LQKNFLSEFCCNNSANLDLRILPDILPLSRNKGHQPMARKAFSSDYVDALPKGRKEPYRLWFEYLKLSQKLIPKEVNYDHYTEWSVQSDTVFDEWFERNWRDLFAIPANVVLIQNQDDYRAAKEDSDCIVVRISRQGTTTQKIADLRKLLDASFGKKQIKNNAKPKFEITAKRNVHYPSLRHKLRFLEMFQEKKTIEATTLHYLEWAISWNTKVGAQSSRKTSIPKSISRFGKALQEHQEELKRMGRAKKTPEYNAARSDMVRFLKSAQKIMRSTAAGRFPGIE
jgi:hypothetical protein